MSKLIKGVHHIALKCDSLEKFEETKHFYTEILGMDILRAWGEGASAGVMIDTGNSIIEIFAQGERLPQGAIHHFAFKTDDVAACLDAVREAGYQVTKEAKNHVIPSEPEFPIAFGFCIGPVGEEIEFLTER